MGDVKKMIAEAVAKEREACAKIAERKARELRRDRDTFASEPDLDTADDIELCATVADDIVKAIRKRCR